MRHARARHRRARFDFFLSYSRHYQDWVRALKRNLLRCEGVAEAFFDADFIAGDLEVPGRIREGLQASRRLIVVHSPESAASPWVRFEMQTFLGTRRQLFVLDLAEAPMPREMDASDGRIVSFRGTGRGGAADDYRRSFRLLADRLGVRLPANAPLEIPAVPPRSLPADLRRGLLLGLGPILCDPLVRKGLCAELGLEKGMLEGHPGADARAGELRANSLLVGYAHSLRLSERRAAERILRIVLRDWPRSGDDVHKVVRRLLASLAERQPATYDYEDLASEVLGSRYRILRVLGKSDVALVFLAADLDLGRNVAVKVRRKTIDEHAFRREVSWAAAMSRRGFVRVYDAHLRKTEHLYIMEYVDGESLAVLREEYPDAIDEGHAAWLGARIAHTLANAHDEGYVHTALSASVILVDRRGRALLLPFGIAPAGAGEPGRGNLSAKRPGQAVAVSAADNQATLAGILAAALARPPAAALARVLARMGHRSAARRFVEMRDAAVALERIALRRDLRGVRRRAAERMRRHFDDLAELEAIGAIAKASRNRVTEGGPRPFLAAFYRRLLERCAQADLFRALDGSSRNRLHSRRWRAQFDLLAKALDMLVDLVRNPRFVYDELEQLRATHGPHRVHPASYADFATALVDTVCEFESNPPALDPSADALLAQQLAWYRAGRPPRSLTPLDRVCGAWIAVIDRGARFLLGKDAHARFRTEHRGCGRGRAPIAAEGRNLPVAKSAQRRPEGPPAAL